MAAVAVAAKGLGLLEKILIAYYFGADARVDAYFVAISLPILGFVWIRELIEPAYLPLFVDKLRAGREADGWRLSGVLLLAVLLLAVALALAQSFAALPLAARLAPGFDADTLALTARLLRLLAPAVVFLSLSSLTYITLNAYGRFLLPATGDLGLKLAPSLCCLWLASELGIEVLALGFLVGALARLGIHGLGLGTKLRMLGLPRAGDRRDLVAFGWLVLPLVLGSGLAQLGELAGNHFSSLVGEGGVAAKNYARKIRDVPLEVVGYSLSVALFPTLAHLITAGRREEALRLLARTVRGLALFFSALGVVVYVLRDPLVSVLLERGAFGSEARASTAYALGMYAPGMSAAAIEGVLVVHFFARKDTRTPVALGILCVILDVVLCASLVGPLGVGGVALALTITKSVKAAALAVLLHRRERCVAWRPVLYSAGRILLAAAFAGLAMRQLLSSWSPDLARVAAARELALIGAVGGLGTLVFVAAILAAGGADRALLVGLARSLPWPRGPRGS